MLDSFFKYSELGGSLRGELIGGFTTFLAMSYIVFVNPHILSTAGMDRDAVFVATCLAAAIGSAIMGLYANYPIALAPGMGLNAYFAFTVVATLGYSWQVALGAVFLSGLLFVAISLSPLRAWIVNAIPRSQKLAISAGIGFLLAIIALENAGIVVGHPETLVTVGDLTQASVILAGLGFAVIAVLDARRVPGAIILGILLVTALTMLLGLTEPSGVFAPPPSLAPTFLQLDLVGALDLGLVTIVFTFLLLDLFDSTGSLIGVAQQAGLLDAEGRLPRLRRALLADSSATMVGAALGTSTTTAYIESLTGIRAGARSGLTAVVVALFFLLALFFAPLAGAVPVFATAPAIFFVACVMARALSELDWEDTSDYVPAMVTAISMPLTFSISTGIGLGFIAYAAIKCLSGRAREAGPAMILLALLFVVKFALS
ncbi:MAG: solute carrier family 23 protein [Rhodospirillales bacterium]